MGAVALARTSAVAVWRPSARQAEARRRPAPSPRTEDALDCALAAVRTPEDAAPGWLDRHGLRLGAALCLASAVVTVAALRALVVVPIGG